MAKSNAVRQIYNYAAFSGIGKQQSAFGAYLDNADIDTRDKVTVSISDNVNRDQEFDCDGTDLLKEAIRDRDTTITLEYDQGFTPQILARWLAYKEGVAAAPTGATTNEVQTLTYSGSVTGGTFTISLALEGKTGLTEAIAFDADAATIQAALEKKVGSTTAMGKLIRPGDVVVSGSFGGGGIVLTFQGNLAAANLPLVTIDNTAITGGGTIAAAETTPGDQLSHAISRSADGSLPLLSLITGDKNGDYDPFKYGGRGCFGDHFRSDAG